MTIPQHFLRRLCLHASRRQHPRRIAQAIRQYASATGILAHYQNRQLSAAAAAAIPAFDTTSFDDPDHLFQTISLEQIQALAAQRPTPLRLADMYKYGQGVDPKQRLWNAQFLHKELPIRLAQRAVDLLTLPHGLSAAAPIRKVASKYMDHVINLQKSPAPTSHEEEEKFTDLLSTFVQDRSTVPTSIARGVQVWHESQQYLADGGVHHFDQEMEEALYRFFTARVGLRFLTEHHVYSSTTNLERKAALYKCTHLFPNDPQVADAGCIQSDCNVVLEAERVAELVRSQTDAYLKESNSDLECPEILVVDCNKERSQFTYVPHHLHYIISELLKNSVRATLRRRSTQPNDVEPIKVIVAKGAEDVTIKIADRAGGIPRSKMDNIWKFSHSTKGDAELKTAFGADGCSGASIRGFGLPLARIYARYFGGELTLKSTEGYGLDSYLYLPRLGDSCENLPLRVRHSPGEIVSLPTMYDERVEQMQRRSLRVTK